jgi:hypothetical protein
LAQVRAHVHARIDKNDSITLRTSLRRGVL